MDNKATDLLAAMSNGTTLKTAASEEVVCVKVPNSDKHCNPINPTVSNPISLVNLNSADADILEIEFDNSTPDTLRMLVGLGVVGFVPALAVAMGFNDLSISEPLFHDNFGASTPYVGMLSMISGGMPFILGEVSVASATAGQMAQALSTVTMDLNGEKNVKRKAFTKIDTDLNYAILSECALPISAFQGILYPVVAGGVGTLSAKIIGVDVVGDFAPSLGSC